MPGLRHDPGRGAGYQAGHTRMQFVVHHDTAGRNSYDICKWGRPGYDTGLCQILLPVNGVPWQFCEIDAVCYHAGSNVYGDYNRFGPGLEVERMHDEPLSVDQAYWLGQIGVWLDAEWGIPNVQYHGPRGDADNFRGHVNHSDLHPNPDGLTVDEWVQINAEVPGPQKENSNVVVYGTKDGKWYLGSAYGIAECDGGTAWVHAAGGCPVVKDLDTLSLVGICVTLAKARKAADFWLAKV